MSTYPLFRNPSLSGCTRTEKKIKVNDQWKRQRRAVSDQSQLTLEHRILNLVTPELFLIFTDLASFLILIFFSMRQARPSFTTTTPASLLQKVTNVGDFLGLNLKQEKVTERKKMLSKNFFTISESKLLRR